MTRMRMKRWAPALGLLAAVAVHGPVAVSTGPLAGLVGSGPIKLTSMLVCGGCVGATLGFIYSGTLQTVLSTTGAWTWISICGAACAAAVGIR